MRNRSVSLIVVFTAGVALSASFALSGQNEKSSGAAKKQEQSVGSFFKGVSPQTVNGKPTKIDVQIDEAGYALDALPDKDRNLPYDHHRMSGVWEIIPATNIPEAVSSRVPPLTPLGKQMFAKTKPGGGPRVVWADINDAELTCDPTGWPRIVYKTVRPMEHLQLADRELQHWAWHDAWRTIYTDGRKLPKDPDPVWWGYSVGKWVGDSFVADTTGEDDRTWLDHYGDVHSVNMMVHEVWHRLDHNTMALNITVTDPAVYNEPWVGDTKLFEYYPNLEVDSLPCVPSEELGYGSHFEGPESTGNPSAPSIH